MKQHDDLFESMSIGAVSVSITAMAASRQRSWLTRLLRAPRGTTLITRGFDR